jgi:serine/threonine protein kinase
MTMAEDRQREQRYAEAAAYLGEILERVETGKASFEECCSERPHIVRELKELYAACHRLQSNGGSSSRQGASEADQALSSELLGKLSGRKGAFERYEPRGEIAKGGQGTVVHVWDVDLHRSLAMKVLVGKASDPSAPRAVTPRALSRFLEEAQVTGQLDHPGIVPIHELGLDSQGRVYFTMKLVKGRTLKEVFQLVADGQEGWTLTRALAVLLKVCEAMAYAHHKGVMHRDIKPANVMVGRFGEVYVMDWGLARVRGREDRTDVRIAPEVSTVELQSEREQAHSGQSEHASQVVTMDGHVVGTPAYMSPEQALGRLEEVGPHSDVYSVGAMLYHLLAGHMPYVKPGTNPTNYSIWYLVQERAPDALHERAPGAPAELVAICEKAMAREIGARYRDMGELSEDLMAFLEHRVVKAYQTGAAVELRKWIERNKGLAAASAAAVLALIGGLVAALVLKAESDHNAAMAAENLALSNQNAAESDRNAREARRQAEDANAKALDAQREKSRAEENGRVLKEKTATCGASRPCRTLDEIDWGDRLWPVTPEDRGLRGLARAGAAPGRQLPCERPDCARGARADRTTGGGGRPVRPGPSTPPGPLVARPAHSSSPAVRVLERRHRPLPGISPEHGWGVRGPRPRARGASAAPARVEASASDPALPYGLSSRRFRLPPRGRMGSRLWSSFPAASAVRAGRLVLAEDTGIVLVLLPGHVLDGSAEPLPDGRLRSVRGRGPPTTSRSPFSAEVRGMRRAVGAGLDGPGIYSPAFKPLGDEAMHPWSRWRLADRRALFRLGREDPDRGVRGARGGRDGRGRAQAARGRGLILPHRGPNVVDWATGWLDDGPGACGRGHVELLRPARRARQRGQWCHAARELRSGPARGGRTARGARRRGDGATSADPAATTCRARCAARPRASQPAGRPAKILSSLPSSAALGWSTATLGPTVDRSGAER